MISFSIIVYTYTMKNIINIILIILIFISCSTSKGSLYRDTVEVEKKEAGLESDDYESEEPEPQKTGLEIQSDPDDADVYLDGRYMGITPIFLSDLGPGKYRLILKKQGYYNYTDWIDFYEDYLLIEADLKPITGFFIIETHPKDAQIEIGSESLSSGSTAEIPVGSYSLYVRAFGYKDHYATVHINENELTSATVALKEAEFSLSGLHVSRRAFNPLNAGLLGRINVSFQVTSQGTGRASIMNEQNEEVSSYTFSPFQTWDQGFVWSGRTRSGLSLPDGLYTILIEAFPGDTHVDGRALRDEISVRIDSSILITFRSLWSGSSGLLYAASPEVLPPHAVQLSSLFLAHAEWLDDKYSFRVPWNIGLRTGLGSNLELDTLAGVIVGLFEYKEDKVVFIPFFASTSLKACLIRARGNFGFGSAALVKLTYQNVHTDTMANFTGFSAGLPSGLRLGPVGILLSPEIVISYTDITYDPEADPETGFFLWSYVRTGLILDMGTLTLGVSTSFRSKPFNRGFGLDTPLQAGLEANWMIPNTQLFLSLGLAIEFSSASDFYILSGGGLGLLQ